MSSAAAKTVSFIVCTNGYGHFKRVTGVCVELVKKYPDIRLNIFCAPFHLQNTQNWPDTVFLSGKNTVRFFTGPMENAPVWGSSSYTFSMYSDWRNALTGIGELASSQLVVSDNYTAPLNLFPKVVLMGSFLWHDILQNTGRDAEIVAFEKQVLDAAGKPAMICLKDMAMPAVVNTTQAVLMPWFCERANKQQERTGNTGSILVTGGGTTASDELLINMLEALSKDSSVRVYTDSKLFDKASDAGLNPEKFGYTDDAFAQLDMLICRPGIGILTDAVKYGIPAICMAEAGNPEMEFNSARVEELGIGKNMMGCTAEELVAGIKNLYTTNKLQGMRKNIAGLATGGAAVAADYIYSQL